MDSEGGNKMKEEKRHCETCGIELEKEDTFSIEGIDEVFCEECWRDQEDLQETADAHAEHYGYRAEEDYYHYGPGDMRY